uniref:Uncharacterized protein n=1 Tax=Acrobeloides nanus TaxID=290746 RepID=A0A914DFE1_9BILA
MSSESLNATLKSFNNNTYIELADQIAECYSLMICPINILLIVVMFPLFIIEGKRYHRNYCMLRIHVLIAFASLSIGFSSSALLSFIEGN